MMWLWALWALFGYACGSIPVAWLIGRAHDIDIREVGSGNVGATNVGRTLGRRWGGLCLILDVFKGLVPVMVSGLAMGVAANTNIAAQQTWCWLTVAAAAVFGHVFPVWLRFRGGKGVATGLGVLLGFWPLLTVPTAAAVVMWLLVAGIFRRISLASVAAALALPCCVWLTSMAVSTNATDMHPYLIVTTFMAILVIVRHRGNIVRLLAGTEERIGEKADDTTPSQ